MSNSDFRFILKGETVVFIDWANVYGWKSSGQRTIEPAKLYKYLKTYKEIFDIIFYFGEDVHPKSKSFLKTVKKIGFEVVTKPVKYIPVSLDSSHFKSITKEIKYSLSVNKKLQAEEIEQILRMLDKKILRRKCDFDIEIAMDVYRLLQRRKTFIFFSGDGDFAPLLNFLANQGKQVIVIFGEGHLGKEVVKLGRKVFLCSIKNIPPISRGA